MRGPATGADAAVSIILPTFNRASFLADAFQSIAGQSYTAWELIVVDDGSTDDTGRVLEGLAGGISPQQVRVIRRANGGAYAARNTGLDHALGRYVAFFDSDDLWLPHHLADCVSALDTHPSIDWIYASCRMVAPDGRIVSPSTFYVDGNPRPFMQLDAESHGPVRIIRDAGTLRCQVEHGLYCGLQNSVIRRSIFETRRFWEGSRVVEDVLFVIRMIAAGARFAYLDNPHVLYRMHEGNSSGSSVSKDADKTLAIFEEYVTGLEQLLRELPLDADARRVLRWRLAHERFWGVGYAGHWQAGRWEAALAAFRQAIGEWPWSLGMWKTYALSAVRSRRAGSTRTWLV